jgi:hypothetical protein
MMRVGALKLSFAKLILIFGIILTIIAVAYSNHGNAANVNGCESNAVKLLESKRAKYSFNRCSQEIFTTQTGQSLTRVRVVAGNVPEKWEFECGYNVACQIHIGWFDEENTIIDFIDAPDVASHDPAVYTLGCGEPNVTSVFDTKVGSTLVFVDNQYWWKTIYEDVTVNNTSTSTAELTRPLCEVNGISMINNFEIRSSIEVSYRLKDDVCSMKRQGMCWTVNALVSKSISACEDERYTIINGGEKTYNHDCARNYIAQTGDISVCKARTSYGPALNCENLVIIKKLNL